MPLWQPGASNYLENLRRAAAAKVERVESKARKRLIVAGGVEPAASMASLLKKTLWHATDEDTVLDIARRADALEKTMGRRKPTIIFSNVGLTKNSGRKCQFFDYILEEQLPESFVGPAFQFRDEVSAFGWSLSVDSGVVFASSRHRGEFAAGFVSRDFTSHPRLSSEMPSWKRGDFERGNPECFACSIRFSSDRLGLDGSTARSYIFAAITNSNDTNQAFFSRMEEKYRVVGFAIELNEGGKNLHLYFAEGERRITAHLFYGKLEVPPETWRYG